MPPETRPDDGEADALERARACLCGARERLADAEQALGEVQAEGGRGEDPPSPQTVEPSWRERLWKAPSEARLGVQEVCEAIGCSESFVYNRTRSDAENPLPHAKLGGALSFKAGELRNWIRRTESVEVAGPSDPPEGTLKVDGRRTA